MGWISPALDVFLNQWSTHMLCAIFFYNLAFNRDNPQLVAACFAVSSIYCIGYFVLSWLGTLDGHEQTLARYSSRLALYFIGSIILAFFTMKIGVSFVTYLTFSVFGLCMILQLLMHIDRTVIGLNQISHYFETGNVVMNSYFDSGYWMFWDFYSSALNTTSFVFILYFIFGESIKGRLCSPQS